MKIKNNIEGFTLVELLIYIAVFSIFMYVTTAIFTSVLSIQVESDTTSIVQQDSRYITERLTYDIRRAESITTPNNAGDEASTLELVINSEIFVYSLNSGNLELTNSNGTHVLNTNETELSNLSFLRIGNSGGKHSIIIDFTILSKVERNNRPEEINMRTSVSTR